LPKKIKKKERKKEKTSRFSEVLDLQNNSGEDRSGCLHPKIYGKKNLS